MLLFSYGRARSALANGVIVVGRAGVTTRESLKRTMERLGRVRLALVVELVLNAVEYHNVDYRYLPHLRHGRVTAGTQFSLLFAGELSSRVIIGRCP
jgi:hypothetical protein